MWTVPYQRWQTRPHQDAEQAKILRSKYGGQSQIEVNRRQRSSIIEVSHRFLRKGQSQIGHQLQRSVIDFFLKVNHRQVNNRQRSSIIEVCHRFPRKGQSQIEVINYKGQSQILSKRSVIDRSIVDRSIIEVNHRQVNH